MNHKRRILADRLIAVPTALLFNGVARLLGRLMRRDHSIAPARVKGIVVAKLIGMGSILQATPLLKALKAQFPHARLTFVTMRANRELLGRLSCIDEVLVLDDRNIFAMASTTLRTIGTLIRRRADYYLDLEVYSAFASLLALWAVTRNRIGFYRHSTAFKNGIYTHLVYFNTRMPVRQLYLQLGRTMGVPPNPSELTGPIRIEEADRSSVRRILSEFSGWELEKPWVVVNPNASDLMLERRWPAEKMLAAVSGIVAMGHQVALIGARDDLPFVQSIYDSLAPDTRSHVANTAGRLTLGELLALLEQAACVLTNDTGPMHIAIALQRPTVCLFGPANPEHYGQDLPHVETFYAQVFCSPCLYEADQPPCNGNNICMQRIEPQAVIRAVQRLLEENSRAQASRAGGRLNCLPVIASAPDGTPLGVVVRASLK